jgi:transcriptional regulator with XRE-family HTH domain
MDDNKVIVGALIRKIRKAQQMSQEKLAEAIGIDPKSLSRIEKGTHYPAIGTLMSISQVLGISIREFFPETGAIFDKQQDLPTLRHEVVDFTYSCDKEKLILMYQYYLKISARATS